MARAGRQPWTIPLVSVWLLIICCALAQPALAAPRDSHPSVPDGNIEATPAVGRQVMAHSGLVTELVNRNTAGQKAAGGPSNKPSMSQDGLIITFSSRATNLVSGDTNGDRDIFVRYRGIPRTVRASVGDGGAQANDDSDRPSIDTFAQYVAFESFASNLVAGDSNGERDIFVRHLPSSTTRRVSVSSSGTQGNGSSGGPEVSADGRYVVFTSIASNLVPGDTNGLNDVFIRDLVEGTTRRVSVSNGGAQANEDSSLPSISGRHVAFQSDASNLVAGDTNGIRDVFVRDLINGTTIRVSVSNTGAQSNQSSDDPAIGGNTVAFTSRATNLVPGDTNSASDVFVHLLNSHVTIRISVRSTGAQGNTGSSDPSLDGSGRYIAFRSDASNLVSGDTNLFADVFRHDRILAQTERWSVATNGAQAINGTASGEPAIADTGHRIAYRSNATNLVPGDTLLTDDIFLTTDP